METLDIPCGLASVPALLWKANKTELQVFALKGHTRITDATMLYHAPFFNIYKSGRVCMGTVKIDFLENCCLEDFLEQWEQYFFKSFFSHMMENHLPVKGNLIQLWKSLTNKPLPFPENDLIKTGKNLKSLLP